MGKMKSLPFILSVDTFCKSRLRKINGLPRLVTIEAGRHRPSNRVKGGNRTDDQTTQQTTAQPNKQSNETAK